MHILKIGFIGLGEMGRPMAKNLLKNQFAVLTCGHIRQEAVDELKHLGAEVVDSPKEVAEASEVTISMVRDTQQTDEVIFGKGFWKGKGVWQGIKTGSVVIICSTIVPGYCQKLAIAGKKRGIDVLDAPVSGGNPLAESGTLTFMVGGDRKVFRKCHPIFKAMGKNIYYLGGPGMGQALKLINNYMMIVTSFGTSEAIALGLKAGLDLGLMLKIIKASSGNSTVVENWDMLATHKKEYEGREKGTNTIFYKDMELAVNFAKEVGVKANLGSMILKLDDSCLFPTELNSP